MRTVGVAGRAMGCCAGDAAGFFGAAVLGFVVLAVFVPLLPPPVRTAGEVVRGLGAGFAAGFGVLVEFFPPPLRTAGFGVLVEALPPPFRTAGLGAGFAFQPVEAGLAGVLLLPPPFLEVDDALLVDLLPPERTVLGRDATRVMGRLLSGASGKGPARYSCARPASPCLARARGR